MLISVGVSWAAMVVVSYSGLGTWLGHGHLLQGDLPLQTVLLAFTLGWLLMVVAMMVPTLPPSRACSPAFIAGFIWIWAAFGYGALLFDAGIHWSVNNNLWLREHAWLIQTGLLAAAGSYQFTGLKRRFLLRCMAPVRPSGIGGGWCCGAASVGCCWALMLTGFAAGMAQLGWTVGLTFAMLAERGPSRPGRVTRLVGAVLIGGATFGALASQVHVIMLFRP